MFDHNKKHLKSTLLTLSLLIGTVLTHAQTNLDSLWNVWQDETLEDTIRLNALADVGYHLTETEPDSALYFASLLNTFALRKGLEYYIGKAHLISGYAYDAKGTLDLAFEELEHANDIFYKLEDNHSLARVLNAMGSVKWTAGEYRLSINLRQQSMAIYNEIGDKEGMASCLQGIAYGYFQMGQYSTAMKRVQESLAISQETGDEEGVSWCINALGVFYARQGNDEKALEYFLKALEMNEKLDDQLSIAYSLRNIASHYYAIGNKDKTLECYERSLAIAETLNNKRGMALSLSSLGNFYLQEDQFEKAVNYYQRSLKVAKETGSKKLICKGLDDMGQYYLAQAKPDLSISFCQQSLAIAIEIESVQDELKACKCLYQVNKDLERHKQALVYHEKMKVLEDIINVGELAENLQQMEFQNQMLADSIITAEEKKNMQMAYELEVSEYEKSRNLYMAGGLFFLMMAIGLYGRNRYVKKSKLRIEIEKERSDNLLLNILPAEVAAELKEKGESEAKDFDDVTVLFTDFVEFTQTAEKLTAKELVIEINACFKTFDEIMDKYNLEKIKTIGDAYMAAGGLQVPKTSGPEDVVKASLEMQVFMLQRKVERNAQNLPAFNMRAGIHTGPVVAGIVGVKKFQYDIWGDTVNTASRIESSGEIGKVNISEATYDILKSNPNFSFENRGKIEAKGKGEIEMYFIIENN